MNAFNGRMNTVWNCLTNNDESVAETAKQYKAKDLYTIIVGEKDFGEGANREYASLEPRFLRVEVILAKSFAHTYEMNLKKVGILALTFADEDDYDRIEEKDLLSVAGLNEFLPGKNLKVRGRHENGEIIEFEATHSYN